MTHSPEDFEDRLRRVLDQAARRLEVPAVAWEGPAPVTTRARRLGSVLTLAGVVVAVAITVSLLALLGHQRAASTAGPTANPPSSIEPRLSGQEVKYIGATWKTVVAQDPACNGTHGSELVHGSAIRALTARFGVLRLPPVPARALQAFLHGRRAPGSIVLNQELDLNQIHLARSAFGARFYVIPAGNVTGQRGVPARCGREQAVVLRHRVAHLPAQQRKRIVTAQTKWLAYLRYLALHPEGICATFIPPHATGLDLGDNFGCATLADFARWGVLADGSAYLGGTVGAFWTVVPDGVATVTVRFPGRAAITARPVNNVVVVRQPWDAPNQSGFPSTITLRARDGRLIRNIKVSPNMITLCGYGC
jgi:hypothetical protein